MRRKVIFAAAGIVGFSILLLFLNNAINGKIESIKKAAYTQAAENLKSMIRSNIEDKRNGTFAIALGLADNEEIVRFLKTGENPKDLRTFAHKLEQHTQYPNVWIQVVDNRGISRYRTWTDKVGDSLFDKRPDVREMLANPRIMNTISVGIFSMTFKSLVPVFDRSERFLGSLEVITHFNSISKHIDEFGTKLIVLADKHYRPQITKPLTGKFIDDYYVVNADADPALLKTVANEGVETFTSIQNYRLQDKNIVTLYTLDDTNGEKMGYFILFKPLDSIDLTSLVSFEHAVKLAVPMGIVLLITAVLLTIMIRRAREARRSAEKLEGMVKSRTRELEELNRLLEKKVAEGIEKQRRQEQHLIQQEKLAAMGTMLTNISHHWRQPLNVLALNIQDFAEANEFAELNETYIKHNIERSMEQIRYMSGTIDNFMHFFKEDKGTGEFSILETLEEISRMRYPELRDARISLILPPTDARITASPGEFRQVMLNIINNAIEAVAANSPDDGRIEIKLEEDNDHITLTVTDNGGGIDSTILDQIFDPYFTTKFKSKGVGISLYMSKIIIENNMNGTLSVDNIQDGARFTIRIPKNS